MKISVMKGNKIVATIDKKWNVSGDKEISGFIEDYLKTKAIPIVSYDSGEITGRKEPNENSLGRFVVLKETLKYVGFSTKYEI